MMPFEKCPLCGHEMIEKQVQKLIRGGKNTAAVAVTAEVCLHCGERLYSRETIEKFDSIRGRLARNETEDFQPLGHSFEVV